jgi:cell shape-determining protein MreC
MRKDSKKISVEYLVLLGGVIFSIGLLILDSLGALSFLRTGISFVMDPVAYYGSYAGSGVRGYFETFGRLNEFRREYSELSMKVYEQEVDSAFYSTLKEENEALKKQIALGNIERRYVLAKVLSPLENNLLRINKGKGEGIAVGDVVVLGNMYIGLVVEVDEKGSLVRLPSNTGSSLEAIVVEGDVESARNMENISVLTKGVVKGVPDGIKIENMSMNAPIKNGDTVIINDTRVGEYLVLGTLTGLSENPAATSRSGYVSPILDYDKLMSVFVIIES